VFKVGATFVCIVFTGDKVDELELLELLKRFIKEFDSLLCLGFGVVAEVLSTEEIDDVLLGVVALFLPVIVVEPYELNAADFW